MVVNRIRRLLSDPARTLGAHQRAAWRATIARRASSPCRRARLGWGSDIAAAAAPHLLALVQRVDIGPDQLIIHLDSNRLAEFLNDRRTASDPGSDADELTVAVFNRHGCGAPARKSGWLSNIPIRSRRPRIPTPALIKAIVNAHQFNERPLRRGASKLGDLAKREKLHCSYYSQVLRLAYLAPGHHHRHSRRTTAFRRGRDDAD